MVANRKKSSKKKALNDTPLNINGKRRLDPDPVAPNELNKPRSTTRSMSMPPAAKRGRPSIQRDSATEHLEAKLELERISKEKEKVACKLQRKELEEARAKSKVKETEMKQSKIKAAQSSEVGRAFASANDLERLHDKVNHLQTENRGLQGAIRGLELQFSFLSREVEVLKSRHEDLEADFQYLTEIDHP